MDPSRSPRVEEVRLEPGAMLGPYRISGAIGAGGMGAVYEAEDTRLHRSVALKLLRPGADHAAMRQRFEREARAIAALNHPHICAVYDVGNQDGLEYLVMEHVRGETLGARLRRGPLPLSEAIGIAIQVADALGTAHAKGIVHRDLKPENIMITPGGAKVLDFGLAKMLDPPLGIGDATVTESPTLTTEGTIVGTFAYMAPEQLEGKECDSRTDVFAFGLALYEMVTGRRAFPQESRAGLIAAVMASGPDFTPIQKLEKPHFERVLRGCLEKHPSNRWQDILDVKRLLEWPSEATAAPPASDRTRSWWLFGLAAAGILAGLLGVLAYIRAPEPVTPLKISMLLENFASTQGAMLAVSPDGLQLAYLANNSAGIPSVWVHRLDTDTSTRLPGTDGAGAPFWSADGRWIAFHSDGKLNKVRPTGERPQKIADVPALAYGTWSGSGDIIFAAGQRSPLYHVHDSGGTPRRITELDTSRTENSHRMPVFLPDGKRFLFTARCGNRENNALYLGSLDSGKSARIAQIQSNVEYVPAHAGRPAEILYVRDGVLVSQEFDGKQLRGEPATVVDGVRYMPASSLAAFAASADGRALVYAPPAAGFTVLTWFDRLGRKGGNVAALGNYTQPRISPDGSRLLFSQPDSRSGNRDLWSIDLRTGATARLTTSPANDWWAVWSPDGKQILFGSDRQGTVGMKPYLKKTMETGLGEGPFDTGAPQWDASPSDWSRAGWMAFNTYIRSSKSDIWVMRAADAKAIPFLEMESNLTGPRFSPDGKWIAYVSDESGRSEVYVRPFRGGAAGADDKIQVSNGGGDFPAWGRSGDELFFISGDGNLKQFDVRYAGPNRVAAITLFKPCAETGLNGRIGTGAIWEHPYDVAPDGRFLFNCLAEPPGRFVVWMNWRAAAQR